MSKKSQSSQTYSQSLKPAILIFAENPHDSNSIKILLPYLNSHLGDHVDISVVRDPPSLQRSAKAPAKRNWLDRVAGVVNARAATQRVYAVLVHQDSDGPDPSEETAKTLAADLRPHFSDPAIQVAGVVPVQELEAWWLLFPAAVKEVRPQAWRAAKFPQAGDTGTIESPKEKLIALTKKVALKHPYREADSVTIAKNISRLRLNPVGVNKSWTSFTKLAQDLWPTAA